MKAQPAPTPAEIKRECKKIQAGWSDQQRDSRLTGTSHVNWTAPEVKTPVNIMAVEGSQ